MSDRDWRPPRVKLAGLSLPVRTVEVKRFGRIRCPEAGDLFFTRSDSWLGKAIRLMTREIGEPPSIYQHVGIVVKSAPTWADAVVVEALASGVVERRFGDGYDLTAKRVEVWRYHDTKTRRLAAFKARKRIGQNYGYLKLLLHAGDWLVSRGRFRLLRRLGKVDRWPICSYLAAVAYKRADQEVRAASKVQRSPFWRGFNPETMTPDDLHDAVTRSALWRVVRPAGSVTP